MVDLSQYLPILIFLAIALGLSAAFVFLPMGVAMLTGAHKPDAEKLSEYECGFPAFEDPRSQFDVRFTADFVRAKEGGRSLPRLPEARAGVGLLWASAAWSFGVDYLQAFPQRQVAAHEFNSDGYRLLGATASRVLKFGALEAEAFLRATNLADREARPHTSLLKDLAPLPGRSVTAGVRFSF